VAFSPDGRTLASGSWDNTIKLWDLESGEIRRSLSGHTDGVNSVTFSPNGKTLASGSSDLTIKLWDVESGEIRRTLAGHTIGVNSVRLSPDGRTLASGAYDGTVLLWDISNLVSEPPVEIPDENLARVIRNALAKRPEEAINEADLESLTELVAIAEGIKDLTDLEYAVNLTHLDLYGNEITDISVLAELPNLTRIDLEGNPLDPSPGSEAMEVIKALLDRGVEVDY